MSDGWGPVTMDDARRLRQEVHRRMGDRAAEILFEQRRPMTSQQLGALLGYGADLRALAKIVRAHPKVVTRRNKHPKDRVRFVHEAWAEASAS